VMTLVVFAIMLTERFGDRSLRQSNRQSLPALVGGIAFFVIIFKIIRETPWPIHGQWENVHVSTTDLARALLGPYVFPFEVISVVLIAALIGAIVMAKRDKAS